MHYNQMASCGHLHIFPPNPSSSMPQAAGHVHIFCANCNLNILEPSQVIICVLSAARPATRICIFYFPFFILQLMRIAAQNEKDEEVEEKPKPKEEPFLSHNLAVTLT